jgi:transposase
MFEFKTPFYSFYNLYIMKFTFHSSSFKTVYSACSNQANCEVRLIACYFTPMGKSSQLTPRKRKCIEVLHTNGLNNTQIAENLGCSRSAVSRLVARFKEVGHMEPKKGRGRNRLSTPREDRILQRICKRNRFESSSSISAQWLASTGVQACASTVRRRLCTLGLSAKRPVKKPLLTATMKRKRLQWAKAHSSWTIQQWRQVLFTDESKFSLYSDRPTLVRRTSSERLDPACMVKTVKHAAGVMVWGSFSYNGVGRIKFLRGTLNSAGYEEIVKKEVLLSARDLFPDQTWIFQQDLAPCHTSKKVRATFTLNTGMHFLKLFKYL